MPATVNSTSVCTSWPLPRFGRTPRAGHITCASEAKAKVTKKRCAASNDGYPTSSTDNSATTQTTDRRQAREDTRGRLCRPARPAQTPHLTLRTSHFPDLPTATIQPNTHRALDTERRLAPTTELRELQYREDDRVGVGKRNRIALAPEYTERYTRESLDPFDLGAIVAKLPSDSVTALLCVERGPGMPPLARSRAPARRARHVGDRHPAGLSQTGSLQVQGIAEWARRWSIESAALGELTATYSAGVG